MAGAPGSGGRQPPVRCRACGDRIGVYEPAVWVIGGVGQTTSQAADPEVTAAHELAFHADCYPGRS
jgi:hypothetical protein